MKSRLILLNNDIAAILENHPLQYLLKNTIDNTLDIIKSNPKIDVMIIGGGLSEERDVSLSSSAGICNALLKSKIYKNIAFMDMGYDIASMLEKINPSKIFNALHGKYGEDGHLASILNLLKIPYTGSGVTASAIAMNKFLCSKLLESFGINTTKPMTIRLDLDNLQQLQQQLPKSYVIKPLRGGSSIGVKIIEDKNKYNLLHDDSTINNQILIEKYIKGRELQVALMDKEAVGILEIQLLKNKKFYDYEAKYNQGFTKHIYPANIPNNITQQIKDISSKIANILNLRGVSRVEMLYSEDDQMLHVIEINTHPGFTPLSIVPEIIEKEKNIKYDELVNNLLQNAEYDE